jgi:hypothetical protein
MALTKQEIETELAAMRQKREEFRNAYHIAEGAVQALEQFARAANKPRAVKNGEAKEPEASTEEPPCDAGPKTD